MPRSKPIWQNDSATLYDDRNQPTARLLEQVAWLMDRAFKIPGTNISVGLDALFGLFPVGGDILTGFVQIGVVLLALAHYRVPRAVAARMMANVLLDIGVGAVPVVGDVFDVFFKANTRNLQLLNEVQKHHEKGEVIPSSPSIWYLVGIAAILILALGFVIALFVVLLLALFSWIGHGPKPL